MPKLKGSRPRPRAALVGNFDEEIVKTLGVLFPTFWMAESLITLRKVVSSQEVDVVILSPDYNPPHSGIRDDEFITDAHIICFSNSVISLPGPIDGSQIFRTGVSLTEEYIIPELSLEKHNLLERDLASLNSVRGLPVIDSYIGPYRLDDMTSDTPEKILNSGVLFYNHHINLPFAIIFQRMQSKLGVAWLPGKRFSIVPWVELICTEWANSDRERFPNFGTWTKNPEWMTTEEIELKLEVDKLNQELNKLTTAYKTRISNVETQLSHTALIINNGKRRLITSQGDERNVSMI